MHTLQPLWLWRKNSGCVIKKFGLSKVCKLHIPSQCYLFHKNKRLKFLPANKVSAHKTKKAQNMNTPADYQQKKSTKRNPFRWAAWGFFFLKKSKLNLPKVVQLLQKWWFCEFFLLNHFHVSIFCIFRHFLFIVKKIFCFGLFFASSRASIAFRGRLPNESGACHSTLHNP